MPKTDKVILFLLTEMWKEGGFFRRGMAEKSGVSVSCLVDVEGLGGTCAFFGVMRGEVG